MQTNAEQLATIRANQTQLIIPDLVTILKNQGVIMAAIDDLNTAVTALQAATSAAVTDLNTLMADLTAALAANNSAGIETAVASINTVVSDLNAAVSANTPPAHT